MIKLLKLFAPVLFMLIVFIGLIVFFNNPILVERAAIDLIFFIV